jgi:RNA polymerase sigma-70 factor (ECF subfamily)
MGARTGDGEAFERELVALIPHLRAFGRTLTGSQTQGDDLAQDTLTKALASRASFAMGTNMKAWTFMILRNLFYSDRRRAWRSTGLDPEVAERTLVSVENPTSAMELDELRRAIAMLPDDQREALILIGAAGLSYEEVSEIAGVAIGWGASTPKASFPRTARRRNQPQRRSSPRLRIIGWHAAPEFRSRRRFKLDALPAPTFSRSPANLDASRASYPDRRLGSSGGYHASFPRTGIEREAYGPEFAPMRRLRPPDMISTLLRG